MKPPPCKDCLCVPICRQKQYYYLIEDCSILDEFLYLDKARFIEGTSRMTTRKERFPESLNEIYETLNPTTWRSDKEVNRSPDYINVIGR